MAHRTLTPRGSGRAVRPFWGLSSGFEDLFEDLWRDAGLFPGRSASRGFSPRVDIEESEDAIRVIAELPGVEEKDFEVSLQEDVLTIRGEKKLGRDPEHPGVHHAERAGGAFHRAFRIPWEIDSQSVSASFKNGVLTVTIQKPKETPSQSRTIPVTSS